MSKESICYAIIFIAEAIIAWLYFSHMFRPKIANRAVTLFFLFGYSILFALSRVDLVVVNAGAFFVINAVIVLICFDCGLKSAILQAAILTIMNGATEILVNLFITYIFSRDYDAYSYSFSDLVMLSVLSKLLFFVVAIVSAKAFQPNTRQAADPKSTLLLVVVPIISTLIVITFIYVGMMHQLTGYAGTMVAISSLALLFLNLAVLAIYNHIQAVDADYMDLQISAMRDEADAEYYKAIQSQYDSQRILIHDIKNHIEVIKCLAKDEENGKLREYISELENLPALKNTTRFCGDPVLNSILIRYSEYCADRGIGFSCDIRSDSVSFMDATSITALFGNLLSNAVEAAETSSGKSIDLSVIKYTAQQCVIISVANSCDNAPKTDSQGNMVTHKRRRDGHGYGTRSIKRVIKRYKGTSKMYFNEQEKQVHIIIQFPE